MLRVINKLGRIQASRYFDSKQLSYDISPCIFVTYISKPITLLRFMQISIVFWAEFCQASDFNAA